MPRPQSTRPASRRSRSVPAGPGQTSSVGALLNHEPPALRRDHVRDNVRLMREKAKNKRAQREEEAAREKPAFKLRQFENVPARLYQETRRSPSAPSRPSSAPLCRSGFESPSAGHICEGLGHARSEPVDSSPNAEVSPGWRVASGYRSLSSPEPPLFSTPPRTTAKMAQARLGITPVKSPQNRAPVLRSPGSKKAPGEEYAAVRSEDDQGAGSEDEGAFDIGNFEKVAKQLKFIQGKDIPAKDAQGKPTRLQHHRTSREEPLSQCCEVFQPTLPAGYRLMPEGERLETLETLKLKLIELDERYRRLPLRIETEGQRRQQQMLRTKITETEKAVGVFSRSSVLVEI